MSELKYPSLVDESYPHGAAGNSFDEVSEEQNRLLRAFPADSRALLEPHLEAISLEAREVLWKPNAPIWSVYFPRSCVTSELIVLKDAAPVEAATCGCEGFVGLPVLLGGASTTTLLVNQVAGEAARIAASVFREIALKDERIRQLLFRYAQLLHEQTAQSVACNARHSVEQRCARWLLMTHDRVGRAEFNLKQEFLAAMLGVRRATVTEAAGMLREAGVIDYRRGRVTIVDREGLEAASCECHAVVRAHQRRLLA